MATKTQTPFQGTADTVAVDCSKNGLIAAYNAYHQPIYRYIYRQVGHVDIARDLTADTFRRLVQACTNQRGPDTSVRAWLYRTAHNLVVDHYRRQQHRNHLPIQETVAANNAPPWQLLDQHATADTVRAALQQLTPDQRQVIILKYLEEMDNAEIATLMDKSIGAVKALQHRALAALANRLQPYRDEVLP